MNEPEKRGEPAPQGEVLKAKPGEATPAAPAPASADQLTKEEQWALFEKELKENDWGHQPC